MAGGGAEEEEMRMVRSLDAALSEKSILLPRLVPWCQQVGRADTPL